MHPPQAGQIDEMMDKVVFRRGFKNNYNQYFILGLNNHVLYFSRQNIVHPLYGILLLEGVAHDLSKYALKAFLVSIFFFRLLFTIVVFNLRQCHFVYFMLSCLCFGPLRYFWACYCMISALIFNTMETIHQEHLCDQNMKQKYYKVTL